MATCPNCGSNAVRWYVDKRGPVDVVDGRLRMSEIGVIAYLACEECSETLKVIDDVEVEVMLNGSSVK